MIEEMVNDAVDDALDSEDIEEETEEEIEKVLTAIAGETAAQLPEAVRREKLKQPATSEEVEVSFTRFFSRLSHDSFPVLDLFDHRRIEFVGYVPYEITGEC